MAVLGRVAFKLFIRRRKWHLFLVTLFLSLFFFGWHLWSELNTHLGPAIPREHANIGHFERTGSRLLHDAYWIPRIDRTLPIYQDNCSWIPNDARVPMPTQRIPKIVHFIFGLRKPESLKNNITKGSRSRYQTKGDRLLTKLDKEFSLVHALVILAAHKSINPETIYFHYVHEPQGKYWDRVKHLLVLTKIDRVPKRIYGQPVRNIAHQADILRLQILQKYGGIYLDIDTVIIKPLDQLLHHPVVMAREELDGICNAFIASEPDSPFIKRWLDNYASFDGTKWNFHSVVLPLRLAIEHHDEICILPKTHFFWPSYYPSHIEFVHLAGMLNGSC